MEARIAEGQAAPGPAMGGAIVLVGFMGAGKSTAARTVAAEMGVEPIDTDRELERSLGEPIDSFFDREGEAAFRAREEEVVLRPAGPRGRKGGGARRRLACSPSACGRPSRATPWCSSRCAPRTPGGARRAAAARWHATAAASSSSRGTDEPLYASVADAVIPPAPRDAVRAALPSLRALVTAPAGTRMVWARSESGSYPAYFGAGLIRSGFDHPAEGRRFVVTDSNVARLHPVEGAGRRS